MIERDELSKFLAAALRNGVEKIVIVIEDAHGVDVGYFGAPQRRDVFFYGGILQSRAFETNVPAPAGASEVSDTFRIDENE